MHYYIDTGLLALQIFYITVLSLLLLHYYPLLFYNIALLCLFLGNFRLFLMFNFFFFINDFYILFSVNLSRVNGQICLYSAKPAV